MRVVTPGVMTAEYGIQPTHYRLPDATHVGCVRLQIGDLDRSVAFYTSLLGFRVIERKGAVAKLGPAGSTEVLIELYERRGARPVPRRGLLGLYHLAVRLPDRLALARFVTHLAAAGAYSGSADHLVSEALYLTDPDGLGIEVYADRRRSEWQVRDRELVMATETLDIRTLMRDARGEPWTGMPLDTIIGHVHLYVGDLRDAEAFYHVALGLDKVVWSYPGALFLSAGGYHHHLGTNTWAAGAAAATDDDARLIEWELVLPCSADVKIAAHHVSAAGYPVAEAGSDRLLTDPWGTALRLTHQK
jgi:catechol 2,3-dioxygenase